LLLSLRNPLNRSHPAAFWRVCSWLPESLAEFEISTPSMNKAEGVLALGLEFTREISRDGRQTHWLGCLPLADTCRNLVFCSQLESLGALLSLSRGHLPG
jgi:hypothetical protein